MTQLKWCLVWPSGKALARGIGCWVRVWLADHHWSDCSLLPAADTLEALPVLEQHLNSVYGEGNFTCTRA